MEKTKSTKSTPYSNNVSSNVEQADVRDNPKSIISSSSSIKTFPNETRVELETDELILSALPDKEVQPVFAATAVTSLMKIQPSSSSNTLVPSPTTNFEAISSMYTKFAPSDTQGRPRRALRRTSTDRSIDMYDGIQHFKEIDSHFADQCEEDRCNAHDMLGREDHECVCHKHKQKRALRV